MPVAYQSPAAIIGELIGMAAEQARNLGLDRLRQKRSRAVAQNLGQRIAKSSWLRELEKIRVGHGVSLLRWRSGGVEHPHDTPPYPFTPSPTFAHSSDQRSQHLLRDLYSLWLFEPLNLPFRQTPLPIVLGLDAQTPANPWSLDFVLEPFPQALPY